MTGGLNARLKQGAEIYRGAWLPPQTTSAPLNWSRALLRMHEMVADAGTHLQSVMDAVVACALAIMPQASGSVVELLEGDHLVYRAAAGTSADKLGLRVRLDASFSGSALLRREAMRCEDTEVDDRVDRAAARDVGMRAMIAVPLLHRGEPVGAFKVYSEEPYAFTEADVMTVRLLAGPLAIGIAGAKESAATAERAAADRRFGATFEQAAVGLAHVGLDGRLLLLNEKFCAIAGSSRERLLGAHFRDITHPDDLQEDLANVRSLVAGEIDHYAMEKRYIRADGAVTWVLLTVSLVRRPDGEPEFFVAVIEDINARKQAERESIHDPLTGLLNRRGGLLRLERELARSALGGEPLIVAFADLDGFKGINDAHGHQEGDRCLMRAAAALANACRPGDVVARFGGDEFLLLLPRLAPEAARDVLARLVESIRDGAADCPLRASIGAVTIAGEAGPAESVLAAADRLMYRAKRGGRDRFELAPWPEAEALS